PASSISRMVTDMRILQRLSLKSSPTIAALRAATPCLDWFAIYLASLVAAAHNAPTDPPASKAQRF
ncbi:MAG TPA: hypothetical protein PLE21_08425, partial [Giesbergeria sp.]|nr:hypothetical protein [Giesbergeria sp.]HRA14561.1 hypothetical protein [Giesbergeria sp.]